MMTTPEWAIPRPYRMPDPPAYMHSILQAVTRLQSAYITYPMVLFLPLRERPEQGGFSNLFGMPVYYSDTIDRPMIGLDFGVKADA